MARAWDSKNAIVKDLSNLGYVAVGISDCVHEKPPPYMMLEETQEEYYRQWSGGAPSGDGPDLKVISEMLSLRHNVEKDDREDTKGDGEDKKGSVELSKSNACATEYIPKPATDLNHNKLSQIEIDQMQKELREKINCPLQTTKGKRERVVAIASLMKVINGQKPVGYDKTPQETNKPIRLLKPLDIIKNTQKEVEIPVVEKKNSLAKVNKQLECLDESTRKGPVFTSATGMFKKKSCLPKNRESPIPLESCPVSKVSKKFVPSERCNSLFKKFEEKVALEEAVEQTIWTKAIKTMREKDTKIRQQTEQFTLVLDNGVEKKFPSSICLPQPRHMLTGEECVVCKVLCTKPM